MHVIEAAIGCLSESPVENLFATYKLKLLLHFTYTTHFILPSTYNLEKKLYQTSLYARV